MTHMQRIKITTVQESAKVAAKYLDSSPDQCGQGGGKGQIRQSSVLVLFIFKGDEN